MTRDLVVTLADREAAIAVLTSDSRKTVPANQTFWLTRDSAPGELSKTVEVWLERPDRLKFEDGVTWVAPLRAGNRNVLYARWSLAHAQSYVGPGVPEDDRQCLRCGDEPAPDLSA